MNRNLTAINIVPGQGSPRLTKAQKAFNRLIQQINDRRAKLVAWEEITPPFQRKYMAEMHPLLQAAEDLRIETARALDQLSGLKGLSKRERRLVVNLVVDLTGGLLAEGENEEMKRLYNKHAHSDFDEDQAAMLDGMRFMFEESLGIDLGDDVDLNSPEAIMARIRERMEEQQRGPAPRARKARRTKSAQALAKEEQQLAETQRISQSIRDIYRKLASALHPDREADPLERERKTVLMQRANQAYEKGNLLQLLELQIELEHIDQAAINGLGEERLSQYNKVIKEQLGELDAEIARVEGEFRMRFGVVPHRRVTPASLLRDLAGEIVSVQLKIRQMQEDLAVFQNIQATKAWLKEMPTRHWMDLDDLPF